MLADSRLQPNPTAKQVGRCPPQEHGATEEPPRLRAKRLFLAASLVFMFHSVPEYVAGDWFVDSDGGTVEWFFSRSQYMAQIDAHFDYKHERQQKLSAIRAARHARITF